MIENINDKIQRYIEYYKTAKKRLQQGQSSDSAFADAPEGFSDWLKQSWQKRKITKSKQFTVTCWYCKKDYGGSICPYCGAKPRF